jgi:hypothetical protein
VSSHHTDGFVSTVGCSCSVVSFICCRSFSRSVSMPLLTGIGSRYSCTVAGTHSCDLCRYRPAFRFSCCSSGCSAVSFNSTRSTWESRGLPRSHFVMLDRTSSVCEPTPVIHSCTQINPVITGSSCISRIIIPMATLALSASKLQCTDGHLDTVGCSLMVTLTLSTILVVFCCSRMATMALSVHMVCTDGHNYTVG